MSIFNDFGIVRRLPEWTRDLHNEYAIACYQAAQAWNFETPALTVPQSIEVYIDSESDPSLLWLNGRIICGDVKSLMSRYCAIVIEVNEVARYVEIEQRILLDTRDGIAWPDAFCKSAEWLQLLVELKRREQENNDI